MIDGIDKQTKRSQCIICDKSVKSLQEGWIFKKFNICYDCIERIFKEIIEI